MLVKFYGENDVDPGEWFVWREEGEEKIEVLVRRIPKSKATAIEYRHFGRKREVVYGRKGPSQQLDVEKQDRVNQEKAAYCLVDTRGFELEVGGASAAEEIGKALGRSVEPGAVVSLDGKWTDPVKAAVLSGQEGLVEWLAGKAKTLAGQDEQEDEEAQGNSQPG